MNINPSTMKQLLQLQMLNKVSFLSNNNPDTPNGSESFSDLFNTILSQVSSGKDGTQAASGMAKLASLKAAAYSPMMASLDTGNSSELASHSASYDPLIQAASRRNGVAPSLVKAVIDTESSFNSKAVSTSGAKGLMQLMDQTGLSLGVTNPFDPNQNIQGGTRYLSKLLAKYNGNQGLALAAYNAGPGRIDRLGITNDQELMSKMHLLPAETQHYVSKVLNLQQHYEA